MAIFRKVHVTFWRDEFVEGLTPEQKFFYLYLLTNDRTTQCGIYEITIKQMCYDTGYNDDTIKKLIEYFIGTGKVRYSNDTKEMALKNWVKYNDSNSPKVKACIDNELKKVKNRVLIQYIYNIDTHTQEEEEEEQEEDKEQEQKQEVNIDFEWFWNEYDKKIGVKEKLKNKWLKLSDLERENAMNYIDLYKKSVPDKQFRKNPETFLNNKSWNDEIIERTISTKLSYAELEWERLKNLG